MQDTVGQFDSLVGQSRLVEPLKRGLATGRFAHAQLLVGPEGSGKRTLARMIARALLCTGAPGVGCGQCPACRQVATDNHPDLLFVKPTGRKSLRVEEIEGLQHALSLKAYEGGKRVAILEDAHMMTPQAQNKLLKTLEEPPQGVTLLLIATQTEPLLPTILSRCQTLRLQRVPEEELAALLQTRLALPPERAAHVAAMADGRVGQALQLAQNPEYWAFREQALSWLWDLPRPGGSLRVWSALQDHKAQSAAWLGSWQTALRDAPQVEEGLTAYHPDKRREMAEWAGRYSQAQRLAAWQAALEAQTRLACNASYAITCDWLLAQLEGSEGT